MQQHPDLDLDVLVPAAKQGSMPAFNSIVILSQRRVFNLCFRLLGNGDDAADATQEAFLKAYRGIAGFQGASAGFVPWLLRIATNACYDQLRKQQRHPTLSLDVQAGETLDERPEPRALADPAPGPESGAATAETRRAIEVALGTLSPDHRAAVVLCDVNGMSYEEAAEVLDVGLGTLKSRLSRARAQLRDVLKARGELPSAAQRFYQ